MEERQKGADGHSGEGSLRDDLRAGPITDGADNPDGFNHIPPCGLQLGPDSSPTRVTHFIIRRT